ncbi:MAG: Hsp20/alpha crystallin family protein [Lachnospiraceae bacterium]
MLVPSIFGDKWFGENWMDDFFSNPFVEYRHGNNLMKTDVKETADGYEMQMSLPGVEKKDIQAELKDGYLTISATTSQNNDEKDEDGKHYIRRERYYGSCSRSFYVGEDITQEDIKARYENGVLTLLVPKKEPQQPEVEEKKYIAIEG